MRNVHESPSLLGFRTRSRDETDGRGDMSGATSQSEFGGVGGGRGPALAAEHAGELPGSC